MDQIEKGKKKKEDVVRDSRRLLNKILKHLLEHKEKIGEKLRESLRADNVLGKCPSCGNNLIVIKMRKGTRFVGCSGYSKGCRTSFPLPAKGTIRPLNTLCPTCNLPEIEVQYFKKRPFRMCINHKCQSKADWGKKAKK
jgi:DNA topoisomerase-1